MTSRCSGAAQQPGAGAGLIVLVRRLWSSALVLLPSASASASRTRHRTLTISLVPNTAQCLSPSSLSAFRKVRRPAAIPASDNAFTHRRRAHGLPGITGGFAPPRPSAIVTITGLPTQNLLSITSAVRPDGTPSLQDALPKSISAQDEHTAALVTELRSILQSIPTESPPGSQDIYGLDTSIAFGSDDFLWQNGGPQGCGGGESSVKPTEDQIAKFKRAVEIVEEIQKKDA